MVEDEKYMARAVAEILRKAHYTVDLVYDGAEGLDYALDDIYDIILLDIQLPNMDGLTILRKIRREGIQTPVILLTARGQLEDKVTGLDLGADDYLPKPFHTEELLARLRALQRRKPQLDNDGILTFGDITFSPHTLTLQCGGAEAKLQHKEAQISHLRKRLLAVNAQTTIQTIRGAGYMLSGKSNDRGENNHV